MKEGRKGDLSDAVADAIENWLRKHKIAIVREAALNTHCRL